MLFHFIEGENEDDEERDERVQAGILLWDLSVLQGLLVLL